jgi:hypothetical protein
MQGLPRWLLVGLLSGVVSVLVFQQSAARLVPVLGFADVPLLWPLAVWGGIWGALLAAALARLQGKRLVMGAALFGAVIPTLLALALVGPLRGQPAVTGVVPLSIVVAALVNGAWGLGTGIGLAIFGRSDVDRRQA